MTQPPLPRIRSAPHRSARRGRIRRYCAEDGFTLIEVMVVLAVVAILALLAVPSYQGKFIREQITAALPLANLAEAPVAASWAATQMMPLDNAAAGLPVPEKIVNNFVASTAIENGAVHITFGNHAHASLRGKTLSFRPAIVPDAPIVPVTWVCGYASEPGNTVVRGINRTTVAPIDLPYLCRASSS